MTFLPFPDFVETAKCLDYKRLGQQRNEAKQILEINLNRGKYYCGNCFETVDEKEFDIHYDRCSAKLNAQIEYHEYYSNYENHPAVLMWRGYEEALALYGYIICDEWKRRNYKDNLQDFFFSQLKNVNWGYGYPMLDIEYFPKWYYKDAEIIHKLCESHQSNLVKKYPEHYRKFFPIISSNIPYFWPVTKEK